MKLLELNNVGLIYQTDESETTALKNISFTVDDGEFVAIVGPSGCGKTTILSLVAGLISPTSGEIVLGDDKIVRPRRDVGYMLQRDQLFEWRNILSNVTLGPEIQNKKSTEFIAYAENLLDKYGLGEFKKYFPKQLSGGMRQNACIAMALAQDTDYIMLDEPTTFLDVSNGLEVMKILRELADGGKGVAAVMHDLPLAFKCSDAVAVLKNGGIAACGTPEHICESGIVRDIFGVGLRYCADGDYYHYTYD